MGILARKVEAVFGKLKAGDISGFARGLVDVGDVCYAWQRKIVDEEVEKQLKDYAMESGEECD